MSDMEKEDTGNESQADVAPRKRVRRRQRMNLPFEPRRRDVGEWADDHRVGLYAMIAAYLIVGIAFFASKIAVGGRPHADTIYIDLDDIELLEQERDRLEAEVRAATSEIDWESIRNLSSNENALNENLSDAEGNNAAEINSAAEAAEARMRANREAYERGLSEVDAIGAEKGKTDEKNSSDVRRKGHVTVSFSLLNPVRYARNLVYPVYRCEGGGEVVVNITVTRGGEVASAGVESGGDECMRHAALSAARASTFNVDSSAPQYQKGTITYIFIPQ